MCVFAGAADQRCRLFLSHSFGQSSLCRRQICWEPHWWNDLKKYHSKIGKTSKQTKNKKTLGGGHRDLSRPMFFAAFIGKPFYWIYLDMQYLHNRDSSAGMPVWWNVSLSRSSSSVVRVWSLVSALILFWLITGSALVKHCPVALFISLSVCFVLFSLNPHKRHFLRKTEPECWMPAPICHQSRELGDDHLTPTYRSTFGFSEFRDKKKEKEKLSELKGTLIL